MGHCSGKRLGTDFAHHPTKCSRACATCADLLPRNLRLTGYASEEEVSRSVAFPNPLQLSHLRFFHLDHDPAEDYSGAMLSRYGIPAGILAGLGIENSRSVARVAVPSVTTEHVIVVRMHFGSAARTLH